MPTQLCIFAKPKSLDEILVENSPASGPPPGGPTSAGHVLLGPGPGPGSRRSIMTAVKEKPRGGGLTFSGQDKLPTLPIPALDHTCKKYLAALKPLQGPREHSHTQRAVEEFLRTDGPELQEKLRQYAVGKTSYIEQFCTSAFLSAPLPGWSSRILTSPRGTIHT